MQKYYKGQKVRRFPRIDEEMELLNAKARAWISRGREANKEAGRIFIQIKRRLRARLGHGHWETHFAENFAPLGIQMRTAQEWMQMAREEDAEKLTADSALSKDATDSQAVKIRVTTEKAVSEIRRAHKRQPVCKIALHLSDAEWRDAIAKLMKSPSGRAVEVKIFELLKKECHTYGFLKSESTHENAAA